MNVLMVTSEAVPYVKSGGLADVAGSLSEALALLKVDVRVLLPYYGSMKQVFGDASITDISIHVPYLGTVESVRIRQAVHHGVIYYALEHDWFTARNGIYGETSFTPYPDNFQRFMMLDKSVHPLCEALGWKPDIIHCHDWTTGLVPYLNRAYASPFFAKTKSIMTIHNLGYQGTFPRLDFLGAGIAPHNDIFSWSGPYPVVNMLKAGIAQADAVTTVSPTYAQEIQTEAYGCGLHELLAEKSGQVKGILNGIDSQEWDPSHDEFFSQHFSSDDLTGKEQLKQEICREAGLSYQPEVPLIAMITRLADQKGMHELLDGSPCALEIILTSPQPVQVMVIGTGDAHFEEKLKVLDSMFPNLSVQIAFSNSKAHRLEGAADFFLMPSRYEPCGLNQMYSLRYGTIPIARKTGGLADSIIDLKDFPDTGTGFLFDEMSPSAIVHAVQQALSWWTHSGSAVPAARKRGMTTDFSWTTSAQEYVKLYIALQKGEK